MTLASFDVYVQETTNNNRNCNGNNNTKSQQLNAELNEAK
jgi:hypothetical protein